MYDDPYETQELKELRRQDAQGKRDNDEIEQLGWDEFDRSLNEELADWTDPRTGLPLPGFEPAYVPEPGTNDDSAYRRMMGQRAKIELAGFRR